MTDIEIGKNTELFLEKKDSEMDIQTDTRKNVDGRLTESEAGVQFYNDANFPQELRLPEELKENPLASEIYRQAKKILCGKEKEISQRDFDYTVEFIHILISPKSLLDQEDLGRLKLFESLRNNELTKKIENLINRDNPESPLAEQRKLLGTIDEDQEKPFGISVLSPPSHASDGKPWKKEEWVQATGAPDMFIAPDINGRYVIYMPDYDAQELDKSPKSYHGKILEHEYRHTQRSVCLGKDSGLFRLIDEPLADVTGYQYLHAFLALLLDTTNHIRFSDLKEAYNSGDNEKVADCFSRIADSISVKGLLLLGGRKSSKCSPKEDGIHNQPLIEGNFDGNDWLQFAETILSLREKNDPKWKQKFRENLQNPKNSLRVIEATYGYHLGIIKRGVEDSDAHLMNIFLNIMKDEIKRRKALSEKGFYDSISY